MKTEQAKFLTLKGTYSGNVIYSNEDEKLCCYTYRSVRETIEGKFGYFNMYWGNNAGGWVIFQYMLLQ